MAEDRTLPYGQPLPASWLAAIQEFIGTAAVNFHLSVLNPTAVQVVAGAGSAQAGIGIDGLFRYITATVTAAVTGGPGGRDIFVVTGPNNFVATGGTPPETDETNYAFALQVLPTGTTPTPTATVTDWRKVGELDWDGTEIVGFRALVGDFDARQPLTPTARTATVIPIRAIGAAGETTYLQTWESSAGTIEGRIDAQGNMTVAGTMTAGTLTTTGALNAGSALVTGATHLEGTLTLDGDLVGSTAIFSGALQAQSIVVTTTLTVDGDATIDGNLTVVGTMTTGGQPMANLVPPIGAQIPYTGYGDPPGGQWVIADGRLIDSTAYAAFDATCGRTAPAAMRHAYNGGTDPLNNKVRIPDKRGKKSIGAINMGTGAGPTGNGYFQGSGGARSGLPGDAGGEVVHTSLWNESGVNSNGTTANDTPDHSHYNSGTSGSDSPDHSHSWTASPWQWTYASGNILSDTVDANFGSPQTGGANVRHSHTWGAQSGGASARHTHPLAQRNADAPHNNVDPYQADSYIVRIA